MKVSELITKLQTFPEGLTVKAEHQTITDVVLPVGASTVNIVAPVPTP